MYLFSFLGHSCKRETDRQRIEVSSLLVWPFFASFSYIRIGLRKGRRYSNEIEMLRTIAMCVIFPDGSPSPPTERELPQGPLCDRGDALQWWAMFRVIPAHFPHEEENRHNQHRGENHKTGVLGCYLCWPGLLCLFLHCHCHSGMRVIYQVTFKG